MPTAWKYYIVDENNRSGRIINGVIEWVATPTPLPNSPDGWQDISLIWEYSLVRYGTMRSFSLPLGFVLDAATILRDGLYRSTVDKKLFLIIQRRVLELDENYFKDYYKFFYKGQFDFSTAVDKQSEQRFEVNLLDGGLWRTIKAKEDTVYSIPLSDADYIVMDGLEIFSSTSFLSVSSTIISNVAMYGLMWLPIQFINSEGTIVNAVSLSQEQIEKQSNSNYDDSDNAENYFFSSTSEIEITLSIGEIIGELNNGLKGELYIKNSNGTRTQIAVIESDNPSGTSGFTKRQVFASQEIIISLAAGEKLYLISQNTDSPLIAGGSATIWSEFKIKINFASKFRTTTIRAYSPINLFKALLSKMGIDENKVVSNALESSTYYITSGDGLRMIDGAVIKTSFKDFFAAFNVYHMLGWGIENDTVRIERRSYFRNKTPEPFDCGNAKDMEISPATDLMFSRLKIGHKEQNIDDVNGKFDFNGTTNYSSPAEAVSNELEIVSPYKAGPYEIEITRINFDGKTTTDGENDNEVYVIDTDAGESSFQLPNVLFYEQDGGYFISGIPIAKAVYVGMTFTTNNIANQGPYTVTGIFNIDGVSNAWQVQEALVTGLSGPITFTITSKVPRKIRRDIPVSSGVPSPATIFNAALSPARLVRIHGPWLRGCLDGYGGALTWGSASRGSELIAGGIAENANVTMSALGSRMFRPWYFDYGTEVPVVVMDADFNARFSGSWEGKYFDGFAMKIGLAPHTREEQKIKLLAGPDIDMTNFI